MIARVYKSYNITGVDKAHLNCDSFKGSIVNGIREPVLYSLALGKTPGHKIYKKPRTKFFREKMNLFYLK